MSVLTSGRFVGQPLRRLEDERILRGRSQFLDDIRLDRTAHLAFVRSPHAWARVLGVRALNFSANESLEEDAEGKKEELSPLALAGTLVLARPVSA